MNSSALRTLLIFGICLPMALLLGYMLADPMSYSSFGTLGIVFFILVLPLLLRYHQPLLLLGWNAVMIVFFLPGAPMIWLPLAALSLGISIFRRASDRDFQFLTVPAVTWPLLVLAFVVFATAEATGGIKLRSFGGEFYGGKRYVLLLAAVAGYFALTVEPIPRDKARRYASFFLLGGVTAVIGDIFYFQNSALTYIYAFFPPNTNAAETGEGFSRLSGISSAASVLAYFMLARYGLRGILLSGKLWRPILLVFLTVLSLTGGFRSALIALVLVLTMQFFLEGLHKTKLLPVMLLSLLLGSALVLPFAEKLPFTLQRALSFLPIEIDPIARRSADDSTDWRLELWRSVLPQVPQYLWLGKGYKFTQEDYSFAVQNYTGTMAALSEDQSWAALAGDYHSGPLSVIIPFGIWGVIAFLWFLVAAVRTLYRNYRYGDPELRTLNTFLLAMFSVKAIMFLLIVGSFYSDLYMFVGYLGLGISLNRGVAKPALNRAIKSPQAPAQRGAIRGFQPALQQRRVQG